MQDILDKYQGIYVNKNYGKDFNSFLTSVEKDVKSKWHPEGTGSVASVFDHEVGHLIDYTIKLRDSDTIKKMYYNLKRRNKISDYLSKYACNNTKDATNIKEFIAEAYAEEMNNSNPRKVARAVWFLMKKKL